MSNGTHALSVALREFVDSHRLTEQQKIEDLRGLAREYFGDEEPTITRTDDDMVILRCGSAEWWYSAEAWERLREIMDDPARVREFCGTAGTLFGKPYYVTQ